MKSICSQRRGSCHIEVGVSVGTFPVTNRSRSVRSHGNHLLSKDSKVAPYIRSNCLLEVIHKKEKKGGIGASRKCHDRFIACPPDYQDLKYIKLRIHPALEFSLRPCSYIGINVRRSFTDCLTLKLMSLTKRLGRFTVLIRYRGQLNSSCIEKETSISTSFFSLKKA